MFLIGCQSTERPENLRKGVEARMHEIIESRTAHAKASLGLMDKRKFTVSTDVFLGEGTASAPLLKISRQLWEKARDAGVTEAQLTGSWFVIQVEAKGKFPPMHREGLGIALPLLSREPTFLGQVGELFMPDGKSAVSHTDPVTVNGLMDQEEIENISLAMMEAAQSAGIAQESIRAGSGVAFRVMSLDAFVSGSEFYIGGGTDPGPLTKNFILLDETGRAVRFDVKRIHRDPDGYDIYEVSCPDVPEMPRQLLRATANRSPEIRLSDGTWSKNVEETLKGLLKKTRHGEPL